MSLKAGAGGRIQLDEFESRRLTAIDGPSSGGNH
jgi:hypothetical protein